MKMKNDLVRKEENHDIVPEGKKFTHAEWRAYEAHKKAVIAGKESLLSASLAAQMFEQFINGATLSQIGREWRGYQLGAIVRAAVESDWHGKKAEYLEHLHAGVIGRSKQTAAESVEFTSTLLAVAHKHWGAKLRRYLATGQESELDGFEIRSIDQYRKVIQTFLELTGHKPSEYMKPPAQVDAGGGNGFGGFDIMALLSTKNIGPEQAAALLALLASSTSAKTVEEKEVTTVTVK
jgi:hypothetical protein